jgi:acyl-CoA synthetase (AMP-forming)/AMP-acid ligase II
MLVFEGNSWTYRQSVSIAGSIIDQLVERGIFPERGPVAVQLSCSDRLACLFLGMYAAGYVAHCVDGHTSSRAYKLSVCPSQALLCNSDAEPVENLKTVFVDQLELDPTRPLRSFQIKGGLQKTIYIEYTSGSTGRPKSVAQKQWRIAHWTRWREFHFPLAAGNDRVATNLFYVWYWHITPCVGGTSVIYPVSLNHDVTALLDYVGLHGCTKIESITPGLISAILHLDLRLPATLQLAASGGEALPMATCREWLKRFPNVALWNNLATTETAADLFFCRITKEIAEMDATFAPISDGIICWNTTCQVINDELVFEGWNVADGYLPPTVTDKFTLSDDRWRNQYRTGDRAKWIDGKLFVLGRVDSTVKVRGYRVDLAGFEASMDSCAAARDLAFVVVREVVWGAVVTDDVLAVNQFAEERIEHHHLIRWHVVDELPYTLSAKRDRKRIEKIIAEAYGPESSITVAAKDLPGGAPQDAEEWRVAAAWEKVLGRPVGREEPWTQAGGHSLLAMRLAKELGIKPAEVYAYPTIAAMAARISRVTDGAENVPGIPAGLSVPRLDDPNAKAVAIVGVSARFPGAPSLREFWDALNAGKDLISEVPNAKPGYIPRKGIVPDAGFDCAFWGIRKEQARGMDTAQRALLECAYEALEDAGFDPFHAPGRIGVVVCGGSLSHYSSEVLGVDSEEWRTERPDEYFGLEIGTDKDYLATTISYRLNLQGPAEVVQAACSSSAVAVVRAVHLLRLGICDYVVCGGASFSPDVPVKQVEGMIWSPEGVCRPFADDANGTVNSDGAGLVVLSRLDAALQRGDWIYATILGASSNNDGARKAGFSAPSHDGQVK